MLFFVVQSLGLDGYSCDMVDRSIIHILQRWDIVIYRWISECTENVALKVYFWLPKRKWKNLIIVVIRVYPVGMILKMEVEADDALCELKAEGQ
jgi:hypothetical protein